MHSVFVGVLLGSPTHPEDWKWRGDDAGRDAMGLGISTEQASLVRSLS